MNANSQLDVHPDAESLNAFAEQALAERERGQILAHLAGCSRCRQVVYLAQEAAAEMERATTVPAVRPASRHESWFRNWRFTWAPVAALAAVVALAYVVHLRRVETVSEMATVAPQTAPQNAVSNSGAVTQATRVPAAPASAAPGPKPSEIRERKKAPASVESAQLPPSFSAAIANAARANEPANAGSEEAAMLPGASGAGYSALGSAAELKREPAVAAWQKEQERAAAASQVHGMAAKSIAQASGSESAKREGTDRIVTAAAPQFDASRAPSASFEAGARPRAAGVFAVYTAKQAGLPSGLAAVSTATAQHRILAVDKAGTVFLSEDSGGHWESVARQWSGHAVAVRMQAAAKANPSVTVLSPEVVFEIVNDQSQVWVSTDGRTWKAK
jgi:hypothetical protein